MGLNQHGKESYRDSLGIVNNEGGRRWIYPKKPAGVFYRMRTVFSGILLGVLFGVPFLTIDGHPFILLNVVDRKFILFGSAFGPHDFYLFVLGMITLIVFIILFTVVFGRLFCGWICPQTVFMEMLFRRVDSWVEGDHRQQRTLDESPWTARKIGKKSVKYLLYAVLSFLIGNTFLAWIIGVDHLRSIIGDPPSHHIAGLTAMIAFSGLFYWIFIWFREQACILVCPYGRLQGVLLDRKSIVIAYDFVRGEPRGKLRRGETRKEGDCIDCNLCVEVCPTGIDIRNGTQLECVNCTACIDACDEVMVKIEKPKRLIRYASLDGITSRGGFRWTPRIVMSGLLFIVLAGFLTGMVVSRRSIDVTVLRTPGMFFQEQPDGRVSNVYDIHVLNKTFEPAVLTLKLQNVPGDINAIGDLLSVPPQENTEGKMLIMLDRNVLKGISTPISIGVWNGDAFIETVNTSFLGPGKPQ